MTTPESAVLTAVIDLLVWQYKAVVLRINSGAKLPTEPPQIGDNRARFVRFYHWQCLGQDKLEKGVSDVLALLPPPPGAVVSYPDAVGKWAERVTLWGLLVAVECKSPDRRQRNGEPAQPSPEQALFLAAVRERGGLALVVDDVGQVIAALAERGY